MYIELGGKVVQCGENLLVYSKYRRLLDFLRIEPLLDNRLHPHEFQDVRTAKQLPDLDERKVEFVPD